MPHNYTPKTDGETLLRHQIARVKARIRKLEKDGNEYKDPIVSIPYSQAVDLVDRHKKRKDKVETLLNVAGELSFQLDAEFVTYNVTSLRKLCDKLIVVASEIK